jgi:hypothetical protein
MAERRRQRDGGRCGDDGDFGDGGRETLIWKEEERGNKCIIRVCVNTYKILYHIISVCVCVKCVNVCVSIFIAGAGGVGASWRASAGAVGASWRAGVGEDEEGGSGALETAAAVRCSVRYTQIIITSIIY